MNFSSPSTSIWSSTKHKLFKPSSPLTPTTTAPSIRQSSSLHSGPCLIRLHLLQFNPLMEPTEVTHLMEAIPPTLSNRTTELSISSQAIPIQTIWISRTHTWTTLTIPKITLNQMLTTGIWINQAQATWIKVINHLSRIISNSSTTRTTISRSDKMIIKSIELFYFVKFGNSWYNFYFYCT